jgi:hypothetical protein
MIDLSIKDKTAKPLKENIKYLLGLGDRQSFLM